MDNQMKIRLLLEQAQTLQRELAEAVAFGAYLSAADRAKQLVETLSGLADATSVQSMVAGQ